MQQCSHICGDIVSKFLIRKTKIKIKIISHVTNHLLAQIEIDYNHNIFSVCDQIPK